MELINFRERQNLEGNVVMYNLALILHCSSGALGEHCCQHSVAVLPGKSLDLCSLPQSTPCHVLLTR